MKFLSAVLVVALTTSQITFAASAKGSARTKASEIAREKYKLGEDQIGRGDRKGEATKRQEYINKAAPLLAKNLISSQDKISIVLTYNPNMADMIVKAAESNDGTFKDLVSKLVDYTAHQFENGITSPDVNSPQNKQMSKLSALLAGDKVATEYVKFAGEIAELISPEKGRTLEQAFNEVAKKYADKKGWSLEKWLKALEDCV